MKRATIRLIIGLVCLAIGVSAMYMCGSALVGGAKDFLVLGYPFSVITLPVAAVPLLFFSFRLIRRSIRYFARRAMRVAVKGAVRTTLWM